jgi:phasin family protein
MSTTTQKPASERRAPARKTAPPSRTTPSIPALGDIGKLIGKLQLPGIDVAAIIDAQRKDVQALADANKQAYDGIKALAQRRDEILRDALVEWQQSLKDAGEGAKTTQPAEMARAGVEKAIASIRELAEMEAQTRQKAWKVLQDRFEENVASLKMVLQPRRVPSKDV